MSPLSASELTDAWLRVQRALETGDRAAIETAITDLETTSRGVDARRLTPFAEALVAWAAAHPEGIADEVVARTMRLDPQLPSPLFLSAHRSWRQGERLAAAREYVLGLARLVADGTSRRILLGSALLCLALALGVTAVAIMLLYVLRFGRRLGHDGLELGQTLFRPGNAWVFASVVLLLPLFAGLGPLWLLVYLFALCWVYLSVGERVVAVVVCVVAALVVPGVELWRDLTLRQPGLDQRVRRMLTERQLDLSTLRELAEQEERFGDTAAYHLVTGELFRMHGELDRMRVHLQKAAREDPDDPTIRIFLGNAALEEGDVRRAVEHYTQARADASANPFVYQNMSLAYDQMRRFQEGDTAREQARELAEGAHPGEMGVRGRDRRLRYPRLGRHEVGEIWSGNAAGPSASEPPEEIAGALTAFRRPLSVVFVVGAALGGLVLAVRRRWGTVAQVCTRCGRVFCDRCKTSTESSTYCSQCISVFLKREMVSIEQQAVKMDRIKRWERWSSLKRRLASILLPGSHRVLNGDVAQGVLMMLAAVVTLLGALVWLPLFLPEAAPMATALPLQVVLLLIFTAVWLVSVVSTFSRR